MKIIKNITVERPILFSAPMVRAILEGRKTQTRRIIKEQPLPGCIGAYGVGIPFIRGKNGDVRCPYGQLGDRLWVRETFHTVDGHRAFYRADYNHNPKGDKEHGIVWTPSIHMPRWASRITLEITALRVEKLNGISGADAVAEGVRSRLPDNGIAVAEYRDLWEQINGGESWSANPWVWVIEFEVVK